MKNKKSIFERILRKKEENIEKQQYQIHLKNKKTKLELEKEEENYKLKLKKNEKEDEKEISITKENNIIEIKKDEDTIVKAKVKKSIIEELEESLKEKKEFEIVIQDENERQIKEELKNLIQKDKKDLQIINEQLEQIEKETKVNKNNEEIKELEKKVEIIKQNIETIKKHYQIISEYYDFKGYSDLNNIILITCIDDYKFYKNQTDIDVLVIKCKEESKKLDTIIEVTNKCIETDKKILEVKKNNEQKNEEYNETKEKISVLDQSFEKIDKNIKEQDIFVKQLTEDIETIDKNLQDERIFNWSKSLLNNLSKIAVSTYLMPIFPSISLIIQSILLQKSVEQIRNIFNPSIKKTIITKKIVENYVKIINDKTSIMKTYEEFLLTNIENIQNLKKEYIQKFSQYKDILEGYEENLKKINKSIELLKIKNEKLQETKKEIKKQKQKVLSLRND